MTAKCYDCGGPANEVIGTWTDRLRDGRKITFSGITITQCLECGELPTLPCLGKAVEMIESGADSIHWNGRKWVEHP